MATPNVPFWDEDPDSWDIVYINSQGVPGQVVTIEGLQGAKRKLDVKKAPGRDGASLADQGYEPSTFQIVATLALRQDLRLWQAFVSKMKPTKGQPPEALSIVHPQLSIFGIDACYITQISQLQRQGHDLYKGTISCIEFIPLKTSTGSGTRVKTKKPTEAEQTSVKDVQTIANTFASAFIGPNHLLGGQAMQRRPSSTVKPPAP